MTNITLVNDVDACIAAAHSASNAFSEALHLAAFNVLHLVDTNGDTRPLNRLYEKLSPAAQDALKIWCVAFGKVKYDPDLLGFKLNRKIEVTEEQKANREAIGPMEYRRERKEKVKKTFNMATACKALFDKAVKEGYNGPALKLLTEAMQAA